MMTKYLEMAYVLQVRQFLTWKVEHENWRMISDVGTGKDQKI
jgi:hypothetical protein